MVVVADAALTQRVRRQLDGSGECVQVPGFLAALGEAARFQVDLVLGPAPALAGMAASTAQALRSLSPRARLVVLAPSRSDPNARDALAHGFDTHLAPDPDDVALRSVLGLPPLSLTAPPPDDSTPQMQIEERPVGVEPPPGEALDVSDLSTLELALGSTGPAERPGPTSVGMEATVAGPDFQLSDTELIDQVLRGRGGLAGLAVRILRERSGFPMLGFASADASTPPGHAAVAVAYRDQLFGQLHAAEPADAALLSAWAHWLARWLRLEDQVGLLRDLSMKDELTGVYNRRYFNRFLQRILDAAAENRQQVTLLVFDIDDFKHYNDAYGHPAGDEILREVAKLIQGSVREHDVVARIGGDEFAVIFWDAGQPRKPHSRHPDDVRNAAARFQKAVLEHRFPKLMDEAAGNLTISGGLAGFPWDGRTPDELLAFADTMAIRSKRQGKNAISFGPNLQQDAPDA